MTFKRFTMLVLGATLTLAACSRVDNTQTPSNKPTEVVATQQTTGWDKVKQSVLKELGLSEQDISNLSVVEDIEDATPSYDVEFVTKDKHYSLTVEQSTGKILESSVETLQTPVETGVTDLKAKEIALADAGVSEKDTLYLNITQDSDDGRVTYEVDFSYHNQEYNYSIDAQSGAILEKDVEPLND